MNQAFSSLFSEAGGTLATAELASNSREIMIYPNPTDGPVWFRAHADLLGSRAVVAVYTVVGSRIMEKTFPASKTPRWISPRCRKAYTSSPSR